MAINAQQQQADLFQSPCGDLVSGKDEIKEAFHQEFETELFQSPCGDLISGKILPKDCARDCGWLNVSVPLRGFD